MVIQLIGRRSTGDLETETACLKYYQTATLLDDFNFDLVKHFHPLGRGRAGQNCIGKKEKWPRGLLNFQRDSQLVAILRRNAKRESGRIALRDRAHGDERCAG